MGEAPLALPWGGLSTMGRARAWDTGGRSPSGSGGLDCRGGGEGLGGGGQAWDGVLGTAGGEDPLGWGAQKPPPRSSQGIPSTVGLGQGSQDPLALGDRAAGSPVTMTPAGKGQHKPGQ